MKIAIDIMSGDFAPHSTINGVIEYLNNNNNKQFVLVGNKSILKNNTQLNNYKNNFDFIEANETISNKDRPSRVIKTKPNSSLVKSINLLKNNEVDAVVSAGNTGCLLSSSLLLLGKINNIKRPALAAYIPTEKGGFVLCDVGANSNNKPIHLLEFAIMSKAYIQYLEDIKNPKIGLLNIGHESNKGSELAVESYKLLKNNINEFIGNIESRDLLNNQADIVVCDGFTGNIVLKLIEGTVHKMIDWTQDSINSHSISKLAKPMLYPVFSDIKKIFDYEVHGGTPLLGVNGIVIKCHGSSTKTAIKNAIYKANKCVETKFLEHMKNSFAPYNV